MGLLEIKTLVQAGLMVFVPLWAALSVISYRLTAARFGTAVVAGLLETVGIYVIVGVAVAAEFLADSMAELLVELLAAVP